MVIKKVQLDIMFKLWESTDLYKLGIDKEQIINVIVEDGRVYLIYWE